MLQTIQRIQNKEQVIKETELKVMKTSNYNLFTLMKGNRVIDQNHIDHLKQEMKKKFLVSPILVNDYHEIIAGQHRFFACKDLGIPIYFIKTVGYGLEDVLTLNNLSKGWTTLNFIKSKSDLGDKKYSDLLNFIEANKEYPASVIIELAIYSNDKGSFKRNIMANKIKTRFDYAKKVLLITDRAGEVYKGYKKRKFILALGRLINNERFDPERFLYKLQSQPFGITDCHKTDDYIKQIENVYNYKTRKRTSFTS